MDRSLMIFDSAAIMPVMDLALAIERRKQLVSFVSEIMREGTDFGVIPGTDKKTLLKPGAEKLTTFFGLTKRFQIIESVEDWTGKKHGGEPFFFYLYRCQLWRGDLLIAEGDGSCNSFEGKYRWRWVNEDELPAHLDTAYLKKRGGLISEFDFAISAAETGGKYGKPAEYWQRFQTAIADGTARQISKKTKNNKEYSAWEINSTVYRVPNDDIASQVNTVQKMSQKRALIAATLLAVNASEFFTQDMEDFIEGIATEVKLVSETGEGDKPERKAPPAEKKVTEKAGSDDGGKLPEEPKARFWYEVSKHRLNRQAANQLFGLFPGNPAQALAALTAANYDLDVAMDRASNPVPELAGVS